MFPPNTNGCELPGSSPTVISAKGIGGLPPNPPAEPSNNSGEPLMNIPPKRPSRKEFP